MAAFSGSGAVQSAEHVVRTRRTEWIPTVLFIQPGDTIIWRGMHGHETMLIDGMGPPQVDGWRSTLDAEGFSVTLTEEGAYIYSCDIHINNGMVGAIVVGDATPADRKSVV